MKDTLQMIKLFVKINEGTEILLLRQYCFAWLRLFDFRMTISGRVGRVF